MTATACRRLPAPAAAGELLAQLKHAEEEVAGLREDLDALAPDDPVRTETADLLASVHQDHLAAEAGLPTPESFAVLREALTASMRRTA